MTYQKELADLLRAHLPAIYPEGNTLCGSMAGLPAAYNLTPKLLGEWPAGERFALCDVTLEGVIPKGDTGDNPVPDAYSHTYGLIVTVLLKLGDNEVGQQTVQKGLVDDAVTTIRAALKALKADALTIVPGISFDSGQWDGVLFPLADQFADNGVRRVAHATATGTVKLTEV